MYNNEKKMEMTQDAVKVLRKEILEQSRAEAESVIESAKKEADRLIREAENEARVYRDQQMKIARDEAEHIKKKILSSVHLELKKQKMHMRELLMNRMLEAVRERLNAFRKDKNYKPFLANLIVQGILALDADEVDVVLAGQEKEILSQSEIKTLIKSRGGQSAKMTIRSSDSDEGGALIVSKDGRTQFDNRFPALVRRIMDSLRLTAIKEVFGNLS